MIPRSSCVAQLPCNQISAIYLYPKICQSHLCRIPSCGAGWKNECQFLANILCNTAHLAAYRINRHDSGADGLHLQFDNIQGREQLKTPGLVRKILYGLSSSISIPMITFSMSAATKTRDSVCASLQSDGPADLQGSLNCIDLQSKGIV
jgi:hypothetical protein